MYCIIGFVLRRFAELMPVAQTMTQCLRFHKGEHNFY